MGARNIYVLPRSAGSLKIDDIKLMILSTSIEKFNPYPFRYHRLPAEAFVEYGQQPWVARDRNETIFDSEMDSAFAEFKQELDREDRLKPAEMGEEDENMS